MSYPRALAPQHAMDVANVYAANLGTPALASTNRIVTSTNMKNGAYTIANASPADGLARNVTVTATTVATGADTPGTITVTGTNVLGNVITEDIIPAQGSTVAGVKAFKTVTSVVGAGWTIAGGNDTIVVGFGNLIGLPPAIRQKPALTAAGQVFLVLLGGAVVAPVVTFDASDISKCTVDASAGTYDGSKACLALMRR